MVLPVAILVVFVNAISSLRVLVTNQGKVIDREDSKAYKEGNV